MWAENYWPANYWAESYWPEEAGVTPVPPPPPPPPSGGWTHDPFSRRGTYRVRKRDEEDEQQPPVEPPPLAKLPPEGPSEELQALDAQIAALGEQISNRRHGRERLRQRQEKLREERDFLERLEARRRLLRSDEEWFLLH